MVVAAVDELLMFGADAPLVGRLLAAAKHRQQIVTALDKRAGLVVGSLRHEGRRLASPPAARQHFSVYGFISCQSPTTAMNAARAASAAVSARRMRGPSEIGTELAPARMSSRSSSAKPPSGPTTISAGPAVKAEAAGSPPASSAK